MDPEVIVQGAWRHAEPAFYVVATPLGNLADLSPRARAVLAGVECIAAEDTRHSQRLLDAWGIRTPMLPAHEHNEQAAARAIVARLARGEHVALISDAGTPGICDPGARIVAAVRAAGFAVVPVPGPSAVIAALSVAGFVEPGFRFIGFLPPKQAARRKLLASLATEEVPVVCYEAPHRIRDSVADMLEVLGGTRELFLARELTKRFEETARLPLAQAPAWLEERAERTRGEFVLILGPGEAQAAREETGRQVLARLTQAGVPFGEAVRLAAELTGASKNRLYAQGLAEGRENED
ncbi:MAG: 16S rRNA (cytidine(1402)-2'-O)-methyltransferase [Rhodocyclales bacterium]|nr:16S rRNA (cytidine(1402)-2'-O)-methyltransferase [Rhodocyclales bacterium]